MAFPFLAAAIGLSTASTLLGGFGAYKESRAAQKSARYKAGIAKENAILGEEAAADAIARGEDEVESHSKKIRAAHSTEDVYRAAQGFVVDDQDPESSAQLAHQDIAVAGASDILNLRKNAEREAEKHRARARQFTEEGELLLAEAEDISPLLATGTTLLTGASRTAMMAI